MISRTIPFVVLGFLGLIGAIVGAMPCGTLCPFGFLQDLLYKISSFKVRIPHLLRHLRFPSLIILLFAVPWLTSEAWFCKAYPVGGLMATLPFASMDSTVRSMFAGVIWLKAAATLFFLVAPIFAKRPFCQMACPVGAFLGLFNRVSLVRLKWDSSKCAHCNKCLEICPMEVTVNENPNTAHCIRCLDCTGCAAVSVTTPFHPVEKQTELLGGVTVR